MTLREIRVHYNLLLDLTPTGTSKRDAYYIIYTTLRRFTNKKAAIVEMKRLCKYGNEVHQPFYEEAVDMLKGETA